MKLSINKNDGRVTVALDGMLDTDSSAEFLRVMNDLIDKGERDILLDLADMIYVSSQGIRTFLAIIKTMIAKEGKLAFCNVRPAVKDILDMSGMSQVMVFE